MTSHSELRERAYAANTAIVRAGLVVLTFGNASELDRSAGLMAIKPSGVPYDRLGPAAMVLVDLETGRAADGDARPSSDTPTHLVLYRSLERLGGIVHTHSPSASAWAQARRDLPCLGTTHADHFHGPVPCTRELTQDEIEGDYEARTGDVIVETIETRGFDSLEMPATLVASHGAFTWGVDAAEAAENAVALETVAQAALWTLALRADTEPIPTTLLDRHFLRKHGPTAYYGQRA